MATTFNKYYYDIIVHLVNRTDNTIIDLNENFINLKVTLNYKKNVFPITEIQLVLDSSMYEIIRTKDVLIKLTINKKILDSLTGVENVSCNETIIENDLFVIIDKNKLEYVPEEDKEEDIPSLNVKLSLFSMNHLNINKFMFNSNYIDCRVVDIISLISKIDQSLLYIERPTNQKKYEQILIPPMNVINMLYYLQKYYKIYKDDLRMFFDFDEYYIMNDIITDKTPIKKNDYMSVVLDIITNAEEKKIIPYDCGYKSNTGDFFYIKTDSDNIHLVDNINTKEEIFGTNNVILTKDDNLDIIREDISYQGKLINKTKLYYDSYDTDCSEKVLDNIYKKRAMFKFRNLDVDSFKCNKVFKCIVNSKSYNFKVENIIFVYTKDKNTGSCSSEGLCYFIEN